MNHFKKVTPYFLMLPAIVIGMLAMISYGVASSIWIQNILIWLVGTVLGFVFLIRNKEKRLNKGNLIYSIVIVVLLVLPFWFNDLDGVHRWLTIGPINLYIASMILPLLIIHLWKLVIKQP